MSDPSHDPSIEPTHLRISPPHDDVTPPTTADTVLHEGAPPSIPVPVDLPGYAIESLIGRGGMGVVYKARQLGLNRPAAVKMIRGTDPTDPKEITRFLVEAEAVAAVKHPHVVQVYECGEHDGQPFLALEYCAGGSLADMLKTSSRLAPRRAAELIEKVARGVEAAHVVGIIHRDLKPSNILLDAAGEPKVADFGLAKRGGGHDLTRTFAVIGTPAYMAPEQAQGGSKFVGPAADVWALGVILYECLTGTKPFDGEDPWNVLQRVMVGDPPSVRSRSREVPRDLELICLKCLRKEPAERYATAAALADDLRNYLDGRPVTARPASGLLAAWKWAKRYPGYAALWAGLTVALVAGAAASTTLALAARAEAERASAAADNAARARQQARLALDTLTDDAVGRMLARQPSLTAGDQAFLRKVIAQYKRFTADRTDTPDGRFDRATAHHLIAQLQKHLGNYQEAEENLHISRDLLASLAAEYPGRDEYRFALAKSQTALGVLLADTGRPAEAEGEYRAAIDVFAALSAAKPDHLNELAAARNNLGNLYANSNRLTEAETELRTARDIRLQLVGDRPDEPQYRNDLAGTHSNLGHLYNLLQKPDQAQAELEAARNLLSRLTADFPQSPEYRRNLAVTLTNLGITLYSTKRLSQAVDLLRDVVSVRTQLAADFPAVPEYRSDLAIAHANLGVILAKTGSAAEAESELRAARDQYAVLADNVPAVPEYRRLAAKGDQNLGAYLRNMNRPQEAEVAFRAARDRYATLVADHPDVSAYLDGLGAVTSDLIDLATDREDFAAARAVVADLWTNPTLAGVRDRPAFRAMVAELGQAVPPVEFAPPPRPAQP